MSLTEWPISWLCNAMRWVDRSTMAQNKTNRPWSDSAEGIPTLTDSRSWEKKRGVLTHICRSLILTKTLKALRSRTPKGTKTQRIWVKTKQGHLKLTEWLLSELTQCDRSVCLKEICYIHNTHLQRKTKPVPLILLFNQPVKQRARQQRIQMNQTNKVLKSTLASFTNNFV